MQRLFFSVDIIFSCDKDLKRKQAYSECLSVLHKTQLVVVSVALAANDATGLLEEGVLFTCCTEDLRLSGTDVSEA